MFFPCHTTSTDGCAHSFPLRSELLRTTQIQESTRTPNFVAVRAVLGLRLDKDNVSTSITKPTWPNPFPDTPNESYQVCDFNFTIILPSWYIMMYHLDHIHYDGWIPTQRVEWPNPACEADLSRSRQAATHAVTRLNDTAAQCSKPLLVDDYRGLYYPIYWGL